MKLNWARQQPFGIRENKSVQCFSAPAKARMKVGEKKKKKKERGSRFRAHSFQVRRREEGRPGFNGIKMSVHKESTIRSDEL
jgi:hypothetical protein